ncbi:MAG: manganese-dependent inorganic pyrophosphatase [Candidatus Riflebacteria bacterium]|nr:manganese-dependent inorganic pyrophosphatase [Candidatus Riflebacteria bacterium]
MPEKSVKHCNFLKKSFVSILIFLFVCSFSFAANNKKINVLFTGHLVPDTDSIMSALAAANYFGGTAAFTGNINLETKYLVNRFKLETPIPMQDFSGKKVYLVDFNQTTQAAPGISAQNIVGIIDHHAIQGSGFIFDKPISITIRPLGSTCTILASMYLAAKTEIPSNIAIAMICGILSDTLNLQSSTTTVQDREILKSLARIAGLSFPDGVSTLFLEMQEAKSNVDKFSANEILKADYKTFRIAEKVVGFGVAETLHPESLISRKQELLNEMKNFKVHEKLDYLFFNVVDTSKLQSKLFILSDSENGIAEKAFKSKTVAQIMDIGSLVSRKNQLMPRIQKILESKKN